MNDSHEWQNPFCLVPVVPASFYLALLLMGSMVYSLSSVCPEWHNVHTRPSKKPGSMLPGASALLSLPSSLLKLVVLSTWKVGAISIVEACPGGLASVHYWFWSSNSHLCSATMLHYWWGNLIFVLFSGCDPALFELAIQLREKRLDIEEALVEEKKIVDNLKKEYDALSKKVRWHPPIKILPSHDTTLSVLMLRKEAFPMLCLGFFFLRNHCSSF